MANKEGKYCFLVEWHDKLAQLNRRYRLSFYNDQTVEIFDIKNRRTFLKRCPYPSLKLSDLFIGAQVTVYAREFSVVDYGDAFTRRALEQKQGRALVLIKPEAYEMVGKIIDKFLQDEFTIGRIKMVSFTPELASVFLQSPPSDPQVVDLVSGNSVAIEFVGPFENVQAVLDKHGPELSARVYASPSQKQANHDLSFIFEDKASFPTTAQLKGCTCCIVKPHAVSEKTVGQIIDAILEEGFEISALEGFKLRNDAAKEFLEVYKTVVPEYNALVEELKSGPCIAMEVVGDEDIVTSFRELCGPPEPEIGQHIRPKSIRARFGTNKVQNAVHCTDLPDDGALECEYFFQILQDV